MTAKRILLFCHDGTGLGHLRRISRIGGALQQRHACIVVSGAREAHWLVPPDVELIKLPAWPSIVRAHGGEGECAPIIEMPRQEVLALRRNILIAIVESFKPDAVIVDYLPFGKSDELRDVFARTRGRKYLVHRGITDTSDEGILKGAATAAIAACYDRIMVMADRRVSDLAVTDDYCPEAAAKVTYCGYAVAEKPERPAGAEYDIVCAGGGGAGSEELMAAGIGAAKANPNLSFCIVAGPRSRLAIEGGIEVPGNAIVMKTAEQLPELLASASVVVCSGGYNTILEAAGGGARILVHPSQRGADDEQKTFAAQLSRFYPVRLLASLDGLSSSIGEEMARFATEGRTQFCLQANGLTEFSRIVIQDLECGML